MKKALIVDDFPDNIFFLQEVIEVLGLEAHSVENGELAVQEVSGSNYDVVFMDIEMPVMNGFEAVEEIRKLPSPQKNVIIIAISAHSLDFFQEKLQKTGFNDYISKPYVLQKIQRVLQKNNVL